MRLKYCYSILLVFIVYMFISVVDVKAMNTGFLTEELSEEIKTTFLSNVSVSSLKTEPVKRGVGCFDVNQMGMIAVGQNGSQGKEVCVYTPQGEYLYGYTFNCNQSFGVEWDGDDLNIYFVRSDIIISLDSVGNVLDIKGVQNSIENNTYVNHFIHSTKRKIGDTEYIIRNDMGVLNRLAASYSQIIVKNSAGTERIIYDVNSTQLTNMIVIIAIVSMFVFIAIAIIARQFIKLRRGN